jgi:predicted nucleic acid-binding protein
MIGLILDTNVLVSANLHRDGIEALVVSLALNRKVQLYVSGPILAEYDRHSSTKLRDRSWTLRNRNSFRAYPFCLPAKG